MSARWILVAAAALSGVAACSAVLGIEDVELIEEGTGGAATTSTTSTATPTSASSGPTTSSSGGGGGNGGAGGSGGGVAETTGAGGPSCQDQILNGEEVGIDCGGPECPACIGSPCELGPDCATGQCVDEICCESACSGRCEGCANELTGEPDGSCAPIPETSDPDDECISPFGDVCNGSGQCRCYDGTQNGGELMLDCGGPCAPCGGTCLDGIQNNGESDIDCGGPCAACPDGKKCALDVHCAGGACHGGTCCTADSMLTTCSLECGNAVNNCGQPVSCGTTCVPAIAGEWGGPAIVYIGPSADAVPSCPPAYPTVVVTGDAVIAAPPAECSACACGDVETEGCVGANVKIHFSGNCSDAVPAPFGVAGQCTDVVDTTAASAQAQHIVANGSCPASGGAATLPPASFAMKARVCSGSIQPAPACGGEVCVSLAPPAFGSRLCVYKFGDELCPADYPAREVVYTGGLGADTRACSACSCDYGNGHCNGYTQFYSNGGCANWVGQADNNGNCSGFGGLKIVHTMKVFATSMPMGGSCEPEGGESIGEVEADSPWTVCCEP